MSEILRRVTAAASVTTFLLASCGSSSTAQEHHGDADSSQPTYDAAIQEGQTAAQELINQGASAVAIALVDDKRIIWSQRFGGGFSVASHDPPEKTLYRAICNGFQYATSIMTTSLRQNLVDLEQFYSDVAANQLPAVTFVKPDVLLDGHPGSSTPPLYEAFVRKIVNSVRGNDQLWKDTAILITFDESGG